MPLLSQSIADLVALDGQPRVAVADDNSQHVLYWDTTIVRSMTAREWLAERGPLPLDPTPRQVAVGVAAQQAAAQQIITDAGALHAQIVAIAGAVVGVPIEQLSTDQVRELMAWVAYRAGVLDKNGVVRPIEQWLQ